MTRNQYRKARRLHRDNGSSALHWMTPNIKLKMQLLLSAPPDHLAERADFVSFCKREGIAYSFRQVAQGD